MVWTGLWSGRKWKSDEVICGLEICRKQKLGSQIEFGFVLDVKVNVVAEFAIRIWDVAANLDYCNGEVVGGFH